MATILITGASSGIGNLAARSLAARGHDVFASMRDADGKNAPHARALLDLATTTGQSIRVVSLDVQDETSVHDAVTEVIADAGSLDAVVHNAGHLAFGYAEAFTTSDMQHLFDVNVIGMQRLNRAVLPHMRSRGRGTLLYVSSTSFVSMPPFLAPYVASKAAFDALAAATALEVGRFGIETVIVQPGAFTKGTMHFAHASGASDHAVTREYSALDGLRERSISGTEQMFGDGVDADPSAVAEEIARIFSLPFGKKPKRSVVDFTNGMVREIDDLLLREQRDFVTRMGLSELL